jgi:exodeoxyribonuclease-1
MMPLAMHPSNSNGIICVDLSADPEALISLDAEEVQRRVFTSADDLPPGVERIPLKVVHVNKVPVVTTHKLVDAAAAERLNIDRQRCEQHWQRLNQVDLQHKLKQVFAEQGFPPKPEAEQQLYGGFLPNQDKSLLDEVRRATADDFGTQNYVFTDARYNKLLFSYRARYFPESLNAAEQKTWLESCQWRLSDANSGYLTLAQQRAEIAEILTDSSLSAEKQAVLQQLQAWSDDIAVEFGLTS